MIHLKFPAGIVGDDCSHARLASMRTSKSHRKHHRPGSHHSEAMNFKFLRGTFLAAQSISKAAVARQMQMGEASPDAANKHPQWCRDCGGSSQKVTIHSNYGSSSLPNATRPRVGKLPTSRKTAGPRPKKSIPL